MHCDVNGLLYCQVPVRSLMVYRHLSKSNKTGLARAEESAIDDCS